MKLLSVVRNSLFVFAAISLLAAPRAFAQSQSPSQASAAPSALAQSPAVPSRIIEAIDEMQLVRLKGNVHPLARPEFDQGAVSPTMPLQRMLLMLKRSPEQQAALSELMVDQYNTDSPNYHKWLTPAQFGAQFGPADSDIQVLTSWLQSHGFQVAKVSKGKLAIEFSGTAARLKEAFHTEIHNFAVNGEQHFANSSDPQIPAALAPVVLGFAPLNDFRPKPMHRVAGEFTKSSPTSEVRSVNPELTTSGGLYAIGPTDFATIYNVLPLWNAGPPAIDGTGVSIAVVGVSNINLQDVTDFRKLFGLPTGGVANTPTVIIDGADPGIINDGAETEALLDTEWSGAVAKGAQIHFVIAADTDIASGLLLAIFNVIDNNSDPILSASFGNCEAALGANGNGEFVALWEQAAAQGITVTVATGDNGSAGCEDQNAKPPNAATTGLQVSGFASTPFNVAVGGTDFNDAGNQTPTYFNSTNSAGTLASAKGYIPESTWNDSCTNAAFGANAEANCNAAANSKDLITVGGSGGASTFSAKPAYQNFITAAHGMPADGARDLPDVSLFASDGFNKSFYVVCEADAMGINPATSCKGSPFQFLGVGGTSASTPSFAGIMALVNQAHGRQGNANFVIYKLAQQQFTAGTACASVASPLPNAACTFNDVTTGTIAQPCTKGSTNCTTSVGTDTYGVLSGYNAGTGYDLATGLGSVNANNFVTNWGTGASAFTSTTTALTLNPTTGITAGQAVTVNITVTGSGGTPSGDVSLTSTAQTGEGVDGFTLTSGKVTNGATTQLTGGTYQVTARYSGDGTFAPSVSSPVTVTVGQAASTTSARVLTCTLPLSTGICTSFTSGAGPVTLYLAANISPTNVVNNSPLTPTGTVTFTDNGTAIAAATNVVINQAAEAFTASGISTFAAGSHSIVAQYSGDPSFKVSSSTAVAFTITSTTSPTITSLSPTSGPVGTSVTITGTNFGSAQGASTVTFNGTAATPNTWSATSIVVSVPTGATTGNVVVTVGGVASNGVTFTLTSSGTFTVKGAAVTVTAGSSGMSSITVTPSGGFTGTVNVTCGTSIPGVTCTPNPLAINITSASAVASNLTVAVAAPSSNTTASIAPLDRTTFYATLLTTFGGGKGWWTLSGATGLIALLLLVLPGRKRYRAAFALGLVCVLSFTLGCGGGYGGCTGPACGGNGTTTTHLTVSSTKVPATGTLTVSASVTTTGSSALTGSVQFYDGATALGSPVPLSSGSTGQINLTAAQAPAFFQLIGTHTAVSAKYLGDAYNSASSSGNLSITITGTTNLPINASPASSNANPTVSLTIN